MSAITGNSLFASTAPTSSTVAQTGAADPTSNASLTSEDTFLKLLVAQIKNQDPTSPTDPTQFVAQLTQYSELEQLIQINGKTAAATPATDATSGATAAATAAPTAAATTSAIQAATNTITTAAETPQTSTPQS